MPRNRLGTYSALTAIVALSVADLSSMARAQRAGTGLNLVYVDCNIAQVIDYIWGFVNDGQGNLTQLYGPFVSLGKGAGTGGTGYQFDADHQLIINPEGTLVLEVDGGSNEFSEFGINSDGTLSTPGIPFPSQGLDPASLAWKDNAFPGDTPLLVVTNKNSDPNQPNGGQGAANYATFSVASNGSATFLQSFALPENASPAQAVIVHNQNKFFGINFQENQVASYQVYQNGGVKQLGVSTPPGPSPQVQGAALHPTKAALYVGLPNQNQIAVYTFDNSGNLTYSSEVANPGKGVGWLLMNAAGTRLYTTEPGSGTISVYNTSAPGKPLLLQHAMLKLQNGPPLPANMAFDPTGQFLYVIDRQGHGYFHILHVASDGAVTEPSLPFELQGILGGGGFGVPIGIATVMK